MAYHRLLGKPRNASAHPSVCPLIRRTRYTVHLQRIMLFVTNGGHSLTPLSCA